MRNKKVAEAFPLWMRVQEGTFPYLVRPGAGGGAWTIMPLSEANATKWERLGPERIPRDPPLWVPVCPVENGQALHEFKRSGNDHLTPAVINLALAAVLFRE